MADQTNMSASCECFDDLNKLGIPACDDTGVHGENNTSTEFSQDSAVQFPGFIRINENYTSYPSVKHTKLNIMFQEMAQILNCMHDYQENTLSFWILDMFIEGLRTAQDSDMDHECQKMTLLWIAFMFNHMQKNDVTRGELFKYLFSLILPLQQFEQLGEYDEVEEEKVLQSDETDILNKSTHFDLWTIPFPPNLGIDRVDTTSKSSLNSSLHMNNEDSESIKKEVLTEINVNRMRTILEILYRIFSRLWVFKALRIIFHETPVVKTVNLPFKLHLPKLVLHLDTSSSIKSQKKQQQQEEEEIDVTSYKNDFILPLQLADGAKTYVRELFNIPSKETIPALTKKSKK